MRTASTITKETVFWLVRQTHREFGYDQTTIRLIAVNRVTAEYALRLTARENCSEASRKIAKLIARGVAVYDTSWRRDTIEIRWQHYADDQWCEPRFEDLGRHLRQIRDASAWLTRAEDAHALASPNAFAAWVGKQGLDLAQIPGTCYYAAASVVAELTADDAAA